MFYSTKAVGDNKNGFTKSGNGVHKGVACIFDGLQVAGCYETANPD